jgi:glycosyltransferase involved in cell wall biosynthesis
MKINSDYVIWVGSVFNDEQVLNNAAISPAGNKWQLNFINALTNSGIKVINIGHCPERVYPFGKFFVSKHATSTPNGIKLISSSYVNLPILRIIAINIFSTIKLASLLHKLKEKPSYLIGYNSYSYNLIPLLFAKYIKKIKWISLVADPISDNTNKINAFYRFADAKVFLSYKLFKSSRFQKIIHFDGGISKIFEPDKKILQKNERIILYTGAIARHTGIELLVEAFALIKNNNIRLVVSGKGNNELLSKVASDNKKITFLGMVDEQTLFSLYSDAFLFINPRLIDEKTNNSNFPSKLLEYLSFCKPVISTYTGGINPAYKEIIQFVYSDDPQDLANKIDEITSWTDIKYLQNSDEIKTFIDKNKKWSKIIVDFNKWALGV